MFEWVFCKRVIGVLLLLTAALCSFPRRQRNEPERPRRRQPKPPRRGRHPAR